MSMSRKDYNKLADAIYVSFSEHQTYEKHQIVQCISNALRGTNPRYQSDRFYRACMNGRAASREASKNDRIAKKEEAQENQHIFNYFLLSSNCCMSKG